MPGELYSFRIQAQNIHGFGKFSDVVRIRASTPLKDVPIPVTWVDKQTGEVRIEWDATHRSLSPEVISHVFQFQDSTGARFFNIIDFCPGLVEDEITLSCSVPMETLTAAPFNYEFE